jgi:hypothetical protein
MSKQQRSKRSFLFSSDVPHSSPSTEQKLASEAFTPLTPHAYKGGRGWKGGVKNMPLDISKLKSHGWKPRQNTKRVSDT